MDLSKGSIYTDHPPGIFLLWVNLPPLTLLKKRKKKKTLPCDQQAEWL
jgi:hypothetical protein